MSESAGLAYALSAVAAGVLVLGTVYATWWAVAGVRRVVTWLAGR